MQLIQNAKVTVTFVTQDTDNKIMLFCFVTADTGYIVIKSFGQKNGQEIDSQKRVAALDRYI